MTKQGLEAIERAAAHENCACVPEGWKLVPVEPTAAQLYELMSDGEKDAAIGMTPAHRALLIERAGISYRYAAMLAAAPAAPTAVAVSSSSDAYDKVDRLLRGSLDDEEYAEYSAALDSMLAAPIEGAREASAQQEMGAGVQLSDARIWEEFMKQGSDWMATVRAFSASADIAPSDAYSEHDEEQSECKECHGSGRVEVTHEPLRDGYTETIGQCCDACQGTGKVAASAQQDEREACKRILEAHSFLSVSEELAFIGGWNARASYQGHVAAHPDPLLAECAEALRCARQWLNGDKWRYDENAERRQCWQDQADHIDAILAKVQSAKEGKS